MFLRTPPSDAFQAAGLVALVARLWNYTRFSLAASLDSYGVAGAAELRAAAADANVSVSAQVAFANDALSFDGQYASLAAAGTRVIALFCQAAGAAPFLQGALAAGVGGPGYTA